MSEKLAKFVEELSTLSVLEAAELVKMLEEKWGVSAAAPVAMVAGGGAAAAAAEPVEEKTEFDVVIKDPGAKKIDVIKVIRQLTSLGLGEAKALAETAGGKILTGVGKDAAMDAKKKLDEAGANIVIE
jgi:large subunit ribosomal protein L7/L12